MMPAFDASILREAWEGDGSERSGRGRKDIAVGKYSWPSIKSVSHSSRVGGLSTCFERAPLFIALAPGFSIGYLIDKNPAPAGYGPLIETGLEPA